EQGDPDESENDEDDEESSIAEGEDREKPKQKAATKSELYKMYAGKTPIAMFTEFMMDRSLRDAAVLITEVADPLENKYVSDLKAQKGAAVPLLSRSEEERHATMTGLKRILDTVLSLSSKSRKLETTLLNDIGWHRETLVLEIFAEIAQCDYDFNNQNLNQILTDVKLGTASTKSNLESVFAHLTDVAMRHNKNAPYTKEECPQSFPPAEAWLRYQLSAAEEVEAFNAVLNVKGAPLPEISPDDPRFPQRANDILKDKIANAGPASDMVSAAALVYALADADAGFSNLPHTEL
ncbi:Uncharacterized protein SCF082_LOCUS31434, partial [Durusdinium trenchii]